MNIVSNEGNDNVGKEGPQKHALCDELTSKIIGAAIEVHKELGPGLLEVIYERALAHELRIRGIKCETQVRREVIYKGESLGEQVIDLLVEGSVVIELKSVLKLPEVAIAQTLSYLKATGLARGLLINFSEKKLINGVRRLSL